MIAFASVVSQLCTPRLPMHCSCAGAARCQRDSHISVHLHSMAHKAVCNGITDCAIAAAHVRTRLYHGKLSAQAVRVVSPVHRAMHARGQRGSFARHRKCPRVRCQVQAILPVIGTIASMRLSFVFQMR